MLKQNHDTFFFVLRSKEQNLFDLDCVATM